MAGGPADARLRNPGIDLLRGLSIVLVVLHHLSLRIPIEKTGLAGWVPRRVLLMLGYFGYEAVFIFFVISGFLIASRSIRRWGALERIDLREFYARRASRILPCLVLLVGVLSALDLLGVPDFTIDGTRQSLWRAMVAAFGLHLNWYEGRTGYLPGGWDILWSLSIEEVFYLGFPLVCLVGRVHRALLVVPLCALAVSLPWARAALAGNEIWQEKAYLPGMAAIAAGVLAAIVAQGMRRPGPRLVEAMGWAGAACVAAVLLGEGVVWPVLGDATILLLTFGVALLMLGCHFGRGRRWLFLPLGWLRSFGRLSYEIYLTHMFVVFPLAAAFRATGGDLGVGWVWFPVVASLAWCLGWSVDRVVSTPAERVLRRLL